MLSFFFFFADTQVIPLKKKHTKNSISEFVEPQKALREWKQLAFLSVCILLLCAMTYTLWHHLDHWSGSDATVCCHSSVFNFVSIVANRLGVFFPLFHCFVIFPRKRRNILSPLLHIKKTMLQWSPGLQPLCSAHFYPPFHKHCLVRSPTRTSLTVWCVVWKLCSCFIHPIWFWHCTPLWYHTCKTNIFSQFFQLSGSLGRSIKSDGWRSTVTLKSWFGIDSVHLGFALPQTDGLTGICSITHWVLGK